jgi:hypothetical protein
VKIQFEWQEDDMRVEWLMNHFEDHGVRYETIDDLFKDIVHDAIDVWYDDHRQGQMDPCERTRRFIDDGTE